MRSEEFDEYMREISNELRVTLKLPPKYLKGFEPEHWSFTQLEPLSFEKQQKIKEHFSKEIRDALDDYLSIKEEYPDCVWAILNSIKRQASRYGNKALWREIFAPHLEEEKLKEIFP